MLDKKEKMVMSYLCKVCPQKQSCLISANQIAQFLCKKYLVTISELDDIMISLYKDNYIDFVASDSKKGYYYCVRLKSRGQTFLNDLKKEKKTFVIALAKTICLAGISFAIGVILKAIFGGWWKISLR